jgi:phage terminase large subunit-like protein
VTPQLPQLLTDARREGWANRIKTAADEAAVLAGCRFDQAAADHVVNFFCTFLRQSQGRWAGQPFEPAPWQREDLLEPLFGWMRPDGTRRFRISYTFLAKKNGKSTLASGIGLYMLAGDGEMGAKIYSAATDREQASIVHAEAMNMVDASPALSRELVVNRSSRVIAYPATQSVYKAMSAEAANKEGLNAHAVIVDELHVWRGRVLWDCLRWAFAARTQPLLFIITTAGDDPNSVCYEQHQYAESILKGEIAGEDAQRYFAYIRAAGEKDDIDDPATWHKANPALGEIIKIEDFRCDLLEAKKSPSSLSAFKRYRLNIWITSSSPAINAEDWKACAAEFDEESLRGRDCVAALDLSQKNDMSALDLVFPDGVEEEREPKLFEEPPKSAEEMDQDADPEVESAIEKALRCRLRFKVLPYFWMPEDTINSTTNINAPKYRDWLAQGFLEQTPGGEVDYAYIRRRIVALKKKFNIVAIVYDPTFAAPITQDLDNRHGIRRIEFPQTVTYYAAPCVLLEQSVMAHRLQHPNHPILNWHAGNLAFRSNVNNYKRPVKPDDKNPRKIDGMVSLIQGLYGAGNPAIVGESTSVYSERGLLGS